MIGVFPDPYPDEIFYSVCARLCQRAGYLSNRIAMRDLFGGESTIASVVLPSHLDDFVSHFPPGSAYTSDYFIKEHTLLPLYSPFLPSERLSHLRQDMHGQNGPALHMRSGIMASHVPLPEWLRLCSKCVIEDKKRYGECFWHRIHQVSGVEVCPFHELYLQNSNVRARNKRTRHEFVSADHAFRLTESQQSHSQSPYHQILLHISRDLYWLLSHHLPQDLKLPYHRYRKLLAEIDLATYRGRVDISMFMQMFKNHYPTPLLKFLHCELEENVQENWLLRLVRTSHSTQHPLHHLLLIHFLGLTAESFFCSPIESHPFGAGPWPCLNPACEHYSLSVIKQCQIVYSQHVNGKPIGTFECVCGFAYSRTGPDTAREDLFKRNKVKSFGSLWERRLRILWEDETASLRAIARQLGVDALTIKRQAGRIGLAFPRPGRTSLPLKEAQRLSLSMKSEPETTVLKAKRTAWLTTMQERPEASVKMLRSKEPGLYTWLYRNDRIWLQAHMPLYRKPNKHSLCVDWKKRDMQLTEEVKVAASRLKNTSGKPIYVTVSSIGREIDKLALLQQHLHKLPQVAELLGQVVETREAFAVRRIEWAITVFKLEHTNPRRWLLIRKAGVERLINHPQVRNAIDLASKGL